MFVHRPVYLVCSYTKRENYLTVKDKNSNLFKDFTSLWHENLLVDIKNQ